MQISTSSRRALHTTLVVAAVVTAFAGAAVGALTFRLWPCTGLFAVAACLDLLSVYQADRLWPRGRP